MPPPTLWFLLLSLLSTLVRVQGSAQTFFPAAIPLSVKSPYLNTWLSSPNASNPISNAWPLFWNLQVCLSVLFSRTVCPMRAT